MRSEINKKFFNKCMPKKEDKLADVFVFVLVVELKKKLF